MSETIQEYHAHRAVSHSKLECYRRRPQMYYRRYISGTVPAPEATSANKIGSALHCAVLEQDQFGWRYITKPDIDRRTKEGKVEFAAFEAQHAGKTILSAEDMADCEKMYSAINEHKLASILLSGGKAEQTWRVPQNNALVALQCRTDYFNETGCEFSMGRPYVVDLKTVESLDTDAFRNFEKACFGYGYHRQAGFYLPLITEVTQQPVFDFFFVAVEKCEPFGVAVYKLTDEAIGRGQDETIEDLIKLRKSYSENNWPNIDEGLIEIKLPKWYGMNKEASK